mmetsp:Transcript_8911/g.12669  ORF Transcript_8911/g.12669 Transcript_8911/m.12669 type:complete len:266 (+) Transcript_8911:37-834(+)
MLGSLFQLKWLGTLCPCLEKAEDAKARKSLNKLGNLRVKWHRSSKDALGKSGLGGLVSGLFSSNSKPSSLSSGAIDAELDVIDGESGPEIRIQPIAERINDSSSGGEITMKQSAGFMKSIPLKQVDKAVSEASSSSSWTGGSSSGNTIVLISEQKDQPDILVRLDLLHETGIEMSSKAVDEVIESFTCLIEWDGRRRAANPEEQEEELEEKAGITARASKAAHFAKREIELQQQKREREKRKAQYVKDAGGLKYTALAMANKEMS